MSRIGSTVRRPAPLDTPLAVEHDEHGHDRHAGCGGRILWTHGEILWQECDTCDASAGWE